MPNQFATINRYSDKEGVNVQLGQAGSTFVDNTTEYTGVFVAFTVVTAATFTKLEQAGTGFAGTDAAGITGVAIDSSNEFPAGATFYGRWDTIKLAGGSILAYHG